MKQKDSNDTAQSILKWKNKKKAKTRDTIRREALRLFNEQGYSKTTIEQIAEASEISRITFFRYFATKADVVLCDVDHVDAKVMESTLSEPPDVTLIRAFRNAVCRLFVESTAEELKLLKNRYILLRTVPELRVATLNHNIGKFQLIREMVAKRTGRDPNEPEVWNIAGVLSGIWISAWVSTEEDVSEDILRTFYRTFDDGLKHLEAGLPI